jgi:hypothetical protein
MKALIQISIITTILALAFQNCAKNDGIRFVEVKSLDTEKQGNGTGGTLPNDVGTITPIDPGTDPNDRENGCGTEFKFGLGNFPYYSSITQRTEQMCDLIEIRYCFNGAINGSSDSKKFNYTPPLVCSVFGIKSSSSRTCVEDGRVLPHGHSAIFFQGTTVGDLDNCIGQIRMCDNGVLYPQNSPFKHNTCGTTAYTPPPPSSDCTFNGEKVPDGSIVMGYLELNPTPHPEAPFNDPQGKRCHFAPKRCLSGKLTQPQYQFSSCNPKEG